MSTICLNMIVRNEAAVITRCLDSVLPHIHSWAIVDTGSTDGTQDLVRRRLAALPGELAERPWTDFGRARTQAIQLAGTRADYLLFMDADDVLVCPPGYAFPALAADAYALLFQLGADGGGHAYRRTCLAATRLPWRFQGVVHEYLDCPRPHRTEWLEGPVIRASAGGARSADPDKYRKDAQVLEEALQADPHNARYVFYLAQSRRDAGQDEPALAAYLRRAAMGGWDEEVFVALYQSALLMDRLGRPDGAVIQAYLKAHQARPVRAEALCSLAGFFRVRQEFHLARMFAAQALAIPRPPDALFLDEGVYRWRRLDELAVASYWTGHLGESRDACRRLLAEGFLPAGERNRVEANLRWAEEKLTAAALRGL
jgi:glycosyltransferase involved in cell wall biosynthesis